MATTETNTTRYRATKRLKPEERSSIILRAARNILVKEGYSRLTLRNAAEQSGIRLATLQYYFPTKAALFSATFEDAMNDEWQRIMGLVEATGGSPAEQLEAILGGIHDAARKDEIAGVFFALWEQSRLDDYASSLMAEFYSETIELIAALIAEIVPDTPRAECKRRATFLLATLEGMTLFGSLDARRKTRSLVPREYAVQMMMDIAMKSH